MSKKENTPKINLCVIVKRTSGSEPMAETGSKTLVLEHGQVIIHISYNVTSKVRIWPSTYLVCRQTGSRSKLLQIYNVACYPAWSELEANQPFTLIFEGLPKMCHSFDLVEEIPEPNELHISSIARNGTDVYSINLDLKS